MSEQDAITTFSICFSGQETGRVGVRVCLAQRAPDADHPRTQSEHPFFFEVTISNLGVQLPNPLASGPPATGHITIKESLPLSADAVRDLKGWLETYARRT